MDIEDKYPLGPTTGYLTKKFRKIRSNAIDIVKAYTSCLRSLVQVPVFGYFDIYEPYDTHAIENYTMYCVEVNAQNISESLLFPFVNSDALGSDSVCTIARNCS